MKEKILKGRNLKRLFSVVLALAMVASLMPNMAMTVKAETTNVVYVDANGTAQTPVDCTVVESSTTTWEEGWYVVNSSVNISNDITVKGNVNLILADDAELIMTNKRIKYDWATGGNLTIWGQSSGTGKIAGTNTVWQLITVTSLTVNGGIIDVETTGNNSHGIICGSLVVNGGHVKSTGGTDINYYGISTNEQSIAIHGGEVIAVGGLRSYSDMIIDGGTIIATRNTNNETVITGKNISIASNATIMAGDSAEDNASVDLENYAKQNYVKIMFAPHDVHTYTGEGAITSEKHICDVCHAEENHNFSKYVSNADGTHKIVCSVCDAVEEGNGSVACTYDAGVVTKQPTTAETGIKTYKCTICGYEITETIPKIALKSQRITTAKIKAVKARALKKKSAKISIKAKASGKGKITYKVKSTPKGMKKFITVSKKGVVTLKKKAKKGSYKITITAAAKGNFKKATKTITIKVK